MADSPAPISRLSLGAVNVGADNPAELAAFWANVIGGRVAGVAGDDVYVAPGHDDGFGMFFRRRTTPRPLEQDTHLDLTTAWGTRDDEVRRLIGLGAVHRWDVLDEYPWVRWSTLADPEGNLFCIAEHPPADAEPHTGA